VKVSKKNIATILLFLVPGLLIYTYFVVYPVIESGVLSTYSWTHVADKKFVGLDNYRATFASSLFWKSVKNSMIFMVSATTLQVVIGFFLGYLVYLQVRGYRTFKVFFFMPTILPSVAVGFIWSRIFSPSMGIMKPLMTAVGLGEYYVSPLADPKLAIAAIILAQVWSSCGVQIILFNSGFMNISEEVIESATIDGAKGWSMIRDMIIPMSMETIKMVIILQLVGSLRAFDLVYMMTTGGPNHATEVLPMHLFVTAFKNFNFGSGSVIAVVIFVLSMAITMLMRKMLARESLN